MEKNIPFIQNGINGIHTASGECIATTEGPDRKEKAQFIVLACNNHYALIEALKEAKETIAWMWENFSIDDKNNQSDAFNIPANTISKIEEAIKQCEG